MKKVLPYILILVALLVGGGIYVQLSDTKQELLPVDLKSVQKDDASEPNNPEAVLKDYGPAPEFTGITEWLNTEPLTMAQLKGKVVLVDFWTYSCINCIRTLPYIAKWDKEYKEQGLVIVGVHTPEFAFEKVTANVEAALKRYAIGYPVAQDNNYKTWGAYKNQFWPAKYLINQEGTIVYTHFGEGEYDTTEKAIRTLLGLEGPYDIAQTQEANLAQTPEIYFGLTRLKNYNGPEKPSTDEQIFTLPKKLKTNSFAMEGSWRFTQEAAVQTQGFARIRLNFNAAKVFMVAESSTPVTAKVYIDGQLVKGVVINQSDLYQLYDATAGGAHTMDIEIPAPSSGEGLKAFTFTFG